MSVSALGELSCYFSFHFPVNLKNESRDIYETLTVLVSVLHVASRSPRCGILRDWHWVSFTASRTVPYAQKVSRNRLWICFELPVAKVLKLQSAVLG